MPERAAREVTIVANDVGPRGGMERQLTVLIGGLLDAGYGVTLISWTCGLEPHPRLRWIRVPGPSRPFALAYPLFVALASALARWRGRGLLHSTGAIVLNRTAVCTVHFCHRAFATLPAPSRASRPGLAHRLNARVVRRMSLAAERWCYRPDRARRLVPVSAGVAAELREHFPRMRGRIETIPNGVDTELFAPANGSAPARSGAGLAALFVGGEWGRKGLATAIEALPEAPAVELTVLGGGDAGAYERLARERGVERRVRFAGAVDEVAPWYRDADLLLLPTAYETFSLVTYEAAASGLALLVTRVNGVEELLRDGVNGWFIERDPADIAARLRALEADRDLLAAMGAAARRDSLSCSWSRVVGLYLELYAELEG